MVESPQTGVRYLSMLPSMLLQVVESCTLSDGDFQQTIRYQGCCRPCCFEVSLA